VACARGGLTEELLLGITVLTSGGKTIVPDPVMELLKLRFTLQRRQKLLWIQDGGDVIVERGTLQSSFRKTILSRGGNTAIPKHVREALKLNSKPRRGEGLMWIQRGEDIIVRKGTPPSRRAS
jgi:bifunctional DNA-binding transcriptional regulator/antitoxin component of YhaV-PrlF toxin-antitoxin module